MDAIQNRYVIQKGRDTLYTLTCKYCGQEFEAKKPDMTTCNACKNRPCEVCGKEFVHPWPYDQHCCSAECRKIWKSDPERNKEWTEKRKATCQEKYGVDNVSELGEVREKISKNHQSEEFKEKVRQTSLKKYGVEHYQSAPEVKEHCRQGYIDKYGYDNISKAPWMRKQLSDIMKSPEMRAKYEEASMKHHGVPHPHMDPSVHAKTVATMLERYGVPYYVLLPEYRTAQASNQISKPNREFGERLNKLGLEVQFEGGPQVKPFDIAIEDSNILIEINPTYSHNAFYNHWNDLKGPDYHLAKTQLAEENGFRCIHIFDWDDQEKIAAMLQPKQTVYARNCVVKRISSAEANEIIKTYHIQGVARGAKHCYGLYTPENELISVMTFSKPRYNKNYQWELLRLCTNSRYRVIGGASKMFKKFIQEVDPESVISYCDRAKFDGSVYPQLGFQLHHTSPPAKIWSNECAERTDPLYITDNYLRQHGFDRIFKTNYGKGTSNEELILERGYRPVYDCGQMVFEWIKQQ